MAQPAQPQAVLDYASPRQRGKFRLPSRSRLEVINDADSLTIVESLAGKTQALYAIGFAVVALAALGIVFTIESGVSSSRLDGMEIAMLGMLGFVWVCGVTVMLLVINNTWRRTVLFVGADAMSLSFSSPFGWRHYEWSADEIEDLRVEQTIEVEDAVLAELQIHAAASPVVHLFTDHPAADLAVIGDAARAMLGRPVTATAEQENRFGRRRFGRGA